MGKALDFLQSCGVFFVSTVHDGVPACRPFGAITEHEGRFFLSTSTQKDVYRQMIENPVIQLVALKPGTREWLRLSGTAVETTHPEDKQRMLAACPALVKRFRGADDPSFALFQIESWEAYLYTDQGRILLEKGGRPTSQKSLK